MINTIPAPTWYTGRCVRCLPVFLALLLAPTLPTPCLALSDGPEAGLPALLTTSEKLIEEHRFADAESVLTQTVAQFPKSAHAYYWLGRAQYEQERDREALKQFERAVRLDGKLAEGHLGVGLVHLRTPKRRLDARARMEHAARLDPNSAQIQYFLALTYLDQTSLGRTRDYGVFVDGQRYLKRAIELDPHHADAYFQLGRSYEFPSNDWDKAIPLFFQQAMETPSHREALVHLARSCFGTGRYEEGLKLFDQLRATHGDQLDSVTYALYLPIQAAAFQKEGRNEEALAAYERYFRLLNPQERALYQDVSFVGSREEIKRGQPRSEPDKTEFLRLFWASRDPEPVTEVNERLVEHYRRVQYARMSFFRGQWPWDRRGDLYVRYGEPDDRYHFIAVSNETVEPRPTVNAKVDEIRAQNLTWRYRLAVGAGAMRSNHSLVGFKTESWVYVSHNLELFFVDQLGTEKFDYPLEQIGFGRQDRYHPRKVAQELIERTPNAYDYDRGGEPLDGAIDAVTYRGENGGTQLEVAYGVAQAHVGRVTDSEARTTWLDSRMALRDQTYHWITARSDTLGPLERSLTTEKAKKKRELRASDPAYLSVIRLSANPGAYRAALSVRDRSSRRAGVFDQPVTVPDYSRDSLSVSDIRLALSVRPTDRPGVFTRHGLEIIPNPARAYPPSQPVYVYYEVYRLKPNASGHSSYRTQIEIAEKGDEGKGLLRKTLVGLGRLFTSPRKEQSVVYTYEDAGSGSNAIKYTSLDTSNLPEGSYTLTLTVIDAANDAQVSKTVDFIRLKD